jgi:hypothetical protein
MSLSDLVTRFSRRDSPRPLSLYPSSLVRVLSDDEIDVAIERAIESERLAIGASTALIAHYQGFRQRGGVVVQMLDNGSEQPAPLAPADSA